MEQKVKEIAAKMGFYFMNKDEAGQLAKLLFKPNGTLNPEIVGKSALVLAEKAGFSVPQRAKILVAREQDAGAKYPYSHEKLCPVLAWFVVENEEAAKSLAMKVLTKASSTFL